MKTEVLKLNLNHNTLYFLEGTLEKDIQHYDLWSIIRNARYFSHNNFSGSDTIKISLQDAKTLNSIITIAEKKIKLPTKLTNTEISELKTIINNFKTVYNKAMNKFEKRHQR